MTLETSLTRLMTFILGAMLLAVPYAVAEMPMVFAFALGFIHASWLDPRIAA